MTRLEVSNNEHIFSSYSVGNQLFTDLLVHRV